MALELRIASPCSVKWEAMTGDERVRRCAECKLQVFNIRELKEAEVRALFAKGGRVCGRVLTGLLIMPPRPELPPSRAAGEDGEAERPTP